MDPEGEKLVNAISHHLQSGDAQAISAAASLRAAVRTFLEFRHIELDGDPDIVMKVRGSCISALTMFSSLHSLQCRVRPSKGSGCDVMDKVADKMQKVLNG